MADKKGKVTTKIENGVVLALCERIKKLQTKAGAVNVQMDESEDKLQTAKELNIIKLSVESIKKAMWGVLFADGEMPDVEKYESNIDMSAHTITIDYDNPISEMGDADMAALLEALLAKLDK